MDDALPVRAGQRVEDLPHQVPRLVRLERALLRQLLGQALAGHELADREHVPLVRLPPVDGPGDAGMVEPRAATHLLQGAREVFWICGVAAAVEAHEPEGDRLPGLDPSPPVDGAEAALPEHGEELVAALEHHPWSESLPVHRNPSGGSRLPAAASGGRPDATRASRRSRPSSPFGAWPGELDEMAGPMLGQPMSLPTIS
ncbi:hypothetical protein BE20_05800 [Sorangium cellulosum]|nr:hypothetical protein BE20_05800 [Sorangium cellulosum]